MSFSVMSPVVTEQAPFVFKTGLTTGPWVNIERWRAGAVRVPAGSTLTSLKYFVSDVQDSAPEVNYQLSDLTGTTVTQTVVANRWFPLPPSLFNFRFIAPRPTPTPGTDQAVILSGVDGSATWRRHTAFVPIGQTASALIPLEGASAGSVRMPNGFVGASVTFEVGGGPGDVFKAVDAANANIVQVVAANQQVAIPREAFGGAFLRIVSNTAETNGALLDVWLKQLG